MSLTDPDRLFPVEPRLRGMARAFYDSVRDLPIISPHGHCEPRWFAENKRFPNPAELLVVPDHYLFRMLASQGVALTDLGIPRADGGSPYTCRHFDRPSDSAAVDGAIFGSDLAGNADVVATIRSAHRQLSDDGAPTVERLGV